MTPAPRATSLDLPAARALAEEAERLASKASPYPGAWGIVDPERDPVEAYREQLAFGSGPVHTVWLPDHPLTVGEHPTPEHAVLLCITGNGPTSEANAQFLAGAYGTQAALIATVRSLCDEVERLRGEIAGWHRYKQDIDEALNRGDGSYRP